MPCTALDWASRNEKRPERVPGPWRVELKLCGQSRANSAAATRGEQAPEAEERGRARCRDYERFVCEEIPDELVGAEAVV